MYACVDVYYTTTNAIVSGLVFADWQSESPVRDYIKVIREVNEYIPGQFYKRELPCILALLEDIQEELTVLVIDGYIWLDEQNTPGLGAYLYDALEAQNAIIGVAKNSFNRSPHAVKVYRGQSKKPLFITATGMSSEEAASYIQKMHGRYRIPTLLKLVDQKGRENVL